MEDWLTESQPKVSEETNRELESPVTLHELKDALGSTKTDKGPGIDGLTVEFYKAFLETLGSDLLKVFNESLAQGSPPLSCRTAVITLLPKKGDLIEIKIWLPVSLLCTEYKIFSKVPANHLREVMDHIIHQDLSYCVPGRTIPDNVS